MEIVGRITADAKINETKSGSKVVNFTIAVNDRYKSNTGEIKEEVTFFNCGYWLATGIAQFLQKGALVEASGRVSTHAWINPEGEAKASLNFHVDRLKIHRRANGVTTSDVNTEPTANETQF